MTGEIISAEARQTCLKNISPRKDISKRILLGTTSAAAFPWSSLTSPLRTEGDMVKGIAFTAYPVNDVARTRRWYEEKLGLQFAGPYIEDGIEKYNEAHVGDECFSLMAAEWTGRAAGSASGVYFEVDNVDQLVTLLQANGVTVEDRFAGPICKQASFSDPEGNRVAIHESTTRRS